MNTLIRKIGIGTLVLILLVQGSAPVQVLAAGNNAGTTATSDAGTTAETKGKTGADSTSGTKTTTDNSTSSEDTLNYATVTAPEDAKNPVVARPDYAVTSYTKDTYFTQTTLKGIFSTAEIYFYVPNYWDTKYVYAEIQYDVSQLIERLTSSVTFTVNGIPIESYRLEYDQGNTQVLYVAIPTEYVKEGYNAFGISAYARIYDEEGCVDDYSGANWLSIDDTSYVRCGYECLDTNHMISYYPYPFMTSYDEAGEGLSIAVSDQATDGEITAAMNLMADLSSETKDDNEIQVCRLSELAATNPERTILVSEYNNLPQEYRSLLKEVPDNSNNACLNFVMDRNQNPLLIITSSKSENLVEAAAMLMDADRVSQEKADTASVAEGSALIAKNATAQNAMIAGNYTLESILGGGLSYVGPFHQVKYVYLPTSQDYVLSDAGKISLKFRYSENLDFSRSMITVSWGEIPVASKKLEKDKASGDELIFDMPTDVVGTSARSLKIAFDMEMAEMLCTPRQEEMPWAYISKESTLYLPASSKILLSFDQKSSPFQVDGRFNDVLLVVSEEPTTNELNLLGQIVAMYGNGVEAYGNLLVKRTSEFTTEDADYNIITAGTYGGNSLIAGLGDKLDFQYNSDGSGFASNEQLILSGDYAGKIAILQLLSSPYALNRGILAVTGANEDSLLNVQEYLRDAKLRGKLTKDCVIIDNDLETKIYRFISVNKDTVQPTMLEKFVANKKSLVFTVVATSIMFLMLIATIIILIRIRLYRKKNDLTRRDD